MCVSAACACMQEHPGSTIVTDSVTSNGLTKYIEGRGGKHLRCGLLRLCCVHNTTCTVSRIYTVKQRPTVPKIKHLRVCCKACCVCVRVPAQTGVYCACYS